jgi:hypothetical protein
MITHLNDRMVNTGKRRGDLEPAMPNRNPPSLSTLAQAITSIPSRGMSKLSCYNSSWPTPRVVALGLGTTPFQLRPPMETSRLLTHRSSQGQERLWRPITGCMQSSQRLGFCVAQRIRRPYSSHSSCREMRVHGGPTTPPLAPRTTKCRGRSFVKLCAPITCRQA